MKRLSQVQEYIFLCRLFLGNASQRHRRQQPYHVNAPHSRQWVALNRAGRN